MWLSKKKKYVAGNKHTSDTIRYMKGAMGPAEGYGHTQKLKKKALKSGKTWITMGQVTRTKK